MRRALLLLALLAAAPARGMNLPVPDFAFGRVTLDAFTRRAHVPPVVFDHWRHRAMFTCRLCHVDVGFAMKGGATEVSAASNAGGYHCGACHDGKRIIQGKVVFRACDGGQRVEPGSACTRCHRKADAARARDEFQAFARGLPRDRFGLVDFEKAEASGLVRPSDFVEGVSIKRDALRNKREITLASQATWMSSVLFSHPKHAVWNGCEVCHPEIFPESGGAERRYTMLSINSGEACGACHDRVAFPLADCERCHLRPVR